MCARARSCVSDVRRRRCFCGRGALPRDVVGLAFRRRRRRRREDSRTTTTTTTSEEEEEEEEEEEDRRRRAIERFDFQFVAPFGKFLGRNDNLLGRFPRVGETIASGERLTRRGDARNKS